jgi:hypothetical protein
MAKPKSRLPDRPADTWEGGFLLDPPRLVLSVSARGGLVVAGGHDFYLLRPGEHGIKTRPALDEFGLVEVAAAEPRAPWRYAVATSEMIIVFFRRGGEDQILRLKPKEEMPAVTHLAWGGARGPCSLYIRREDGSIARMNPELDDLDDLDVPPMHAVASDGNGVVAMVAFEPEPRAYVTRDGRELAFRPIAYEYEAELTERVHLAVASDAVAFAFENEGAYLSRAKDAPFEEIEALAGAGPLEFEGADADAALFGGILEVGMSAIVRVDKAGAAVRIAEMGSDGGTAPIVDALAWDASRSKLWAAAGNAGIITSTSPSAKNRKNVYLA